MTATKAALYNISDSLNNVTVNTGLDESKAALYNLSDSFDNISVSAGLESTRVALYNVSDSLSNIEVTTDLGTVQEQLQQAAPTLIQFKEDTIILLSILFAVGVATLLTGIALVLLVRDIEKMRQPPRT